MYGFEKGWTVKLFDAKTGEEKISTSKFKTLLSSRRIICMNDKVFISGLAHHRPYRNYNWVYIIELDKDWNIIKEVWKKGLVLGSSTSCVIGIYGSDASEETTKEEGKGYEYSTEFTINILKREER
jgi:hypothetical protein